MHDVGVPPLLEVDISRKRYRTAGRDDLEVIAGLRFALPRGAVTCLLGPSGCGKTSALRIILGLDSRFEGAVTPSCEGLKLGVVFQDPRLLPWRTIEDNIRLAAPEISARRLDEITRDLGLADWRKHRPGELSTGMMRRAAIARALSVKPDLLILDEAFVSLDEQAANILRDYVFANAAAEGTTVLMVTHNLDEALRYSDHILVLGQRPARVTRTIDLEAPREARDEAWIDRERRHLERVVAPSVMSASRLVAAAEDCINFDQNSSSK